MKTKHTPGPWTYHLGRGSNPRLHIQTMGGYQIASTPEINPHRMAAEENAGREANAALIAAAPELLAALQGAEKAIVKALPFCPPDDEAHFVGEWLEEIRAAIQKAQGEA